MNDIKRMKGKGAEGLGRTQPVSLGEGNLEAARVDWRSKRTHVGVPSCHRQGDEKAGNREQLLNHFSEREVFKYCAFCIIIIQIFFFKLLVLSR